MSKSGKLFLALSILRARIDHLSIDDATISRRGANIVVHLVGITDTSVALRLVAPPPLRFRPVLIDRIPPPNAQTVDASAAKAAIASCDPSPVLALPTIPTSSIAEDTPEACVVLSGRPGRRGTRRAPRSYLGPAGLTGRAVRSATAEFVSTQGWCVKMIFTASGSTEWDRLAREQFHHQVAIVLDGVVESAPQIQPGDATFTSFGGMAVISGRFTQTEAKDLATLINYGSMPPLFSVKKVIVT
jgi:preprotein translocase subunit SecD